MQSGELPNRLAWKPVHPWETLTTLSQIKYFVDNFTELVWWVEILEDTENAKMHKFTDDTLQLLSALKSLGARSFGK